MTVEIVCILDRSGSMGTICGDAIGGFNTFVEEQKKADVKAALTAVLFDDQYETLWESVPIKNVEKLTAQNYVPRGTTALLDAVAKTIDDSGKRFAAMSSPPEKVLCVILTDGMENASKKFTRKDVLDRITHQRAHYGWEFIFLAANQDAFAEGQQLGIPKSNIANYAPNAVGTKAAYRNVSMSCAAWAGGGKVKLDTDDKGFVR